ncbi:hypothetical protein BDV23DRAFT_147737 [Aspergillus alliaceus]|uniref:DUF3824 domain-containing protein n=1 Tax=Petromyces alliaceus TaxID=209559 RepID=A0A5N7CJE1_PETAA|nr:hypothetical protein BDV23DRAFT_147737 [Aspergillus alliaceus]
MAYYDERPYYPRDRYARPSSVYSQGYYSGDGPYSSSRHETGITRRHNGSNESLPGDYGYEYGYGLPPQPRRSRVSTVQEGVHRSHSMGGGHRSYYDDPDYHHSRHSRRSRRHDYDDPPGDRYRRTQRSLSSSRSPPPRRRRKSFSEQAMEALGMGSTTSSASKHRDHSRGRPHGHHRRSYSYSPSPTRSKSRRRERSEQRIAQAMKAALTAGAVEAFRVRKEPGEWTGDKGKRILTAALTAGGTDGLVDRDPNKHSKRHIIESTLAGLAANHFVNGPRSRSRSKSRGREKSRSRVPDLAAAGALAAAGKEAYNRFKSRSRSRPRGRSHSRDSQEDSPRRERRRSKSISDYINRGMEALGLENKDKDKDDRRRPRDRPSRRDDYSGYDSDSDYGSKHHGSSRRTRHSRDVGRSLHPGSSYESPSSARSGAIGKEGHAYYQDRENHSSNSDKDSDLGSSTDEEHRHKKLKRKTLLATGLATVATIHAAHGLHGSMEKHKKRVKMVKEGDMTAKEARKLRLKNNLTDAASVGLATLGIKGAVDEWRHVDHMRKERHDFRKECDSRRERRHSRAQSQGSLPYRRTMYPDEIEECHISDNGSRRAMSVAQEV